MIYSHYSDVDLFEDWRWKNFSAEELACKCCGEYYHDPESLDMIQQARDNFGMPFFINSGHRCISHNKAVGGSINSQHLKIAFDISIASESKSEAMLESLYQAGFTTFGLYNSFIHTDTRPWRLWIMGNNTKWQDIYDRVIKQVN